MADSAVRTDDTLLGHVDALGYRRPLPAFSTNTAGPSANDGGASGFSSTDPLPSGMDRVIASPAKSGATDLELALRSIVAMWVLYLVLITVRSVVLMYDEFWDAFARRSVATLFGMFITYLVYLALRSFTTGDVKRTATIAGLLCLPASLLFSTVNYTVFYVIAPFPITDRNWDQMDPVEKFAKAVFETSLSWYFLFAAWAAIYVALSYQRQARAADNRASAMAREAQEAQLRALRYQINPHFLFNTLNSLSSLILSQKNDTAERMLMNLSTFFRSTLSADPTADVSLAEEIKLQRLYLDIEQIRFPERLAVKIDVPDSLLSARVPVLILQPIVENAVKYGVAKSRRPVTLSITAFEEAGRLHIKVKDDGEWSGEDDGDDSTGVGLRNVCERLVARYGHTAGCIHGAEPGGGYTVHLFLPVIRNG